MFSVLTRASAQVTQRASALWTASCDEAAESAGQSLDELEKSMEAEEAEKDTIKATMSYNDLKGSLNQCGANTFDGLRLIVQKQVNLNTVVSHFYWVGSQAMPQPLYQYRLILPFDDKSVNVATNMDFTMMEGEANLSLTENIALNGTFGISPNGNSMSATCTITDSVSNTSFNYTQAEAEQYTMSYVQAMTKALSLGGSGTYSDGVLKASLGGLYNGEENVFGAVYGGQHIFKAMYVRKVNPNRVHLSTEVAVNEDGGSTVMVGAEYSLKQSKVTFGVDNEFMIRSTVESTLSPGVQFQLSAEMAQAKEHYRFGYGLIMG